LALRRLTLSAVVFDLYGTLVHEFPRREFYASVDRMGEALGLDPLAFSRAWSEGSMLRQTGAHPTVEAHLEAICMSLGLPATAEAIERAMKVRREVYGKYFLARDGAPEILRDVKGLKLRIGLISMCAPDTPALWRGLQMSRFVDTEIFSCEVGLRKPEPEIYLLACERLGVAPTGCLYVGDGAYGELSGAAAVGMTPVLIRDPDEIAEEVLRPESEGWDGTRIAHLSEVTRFL
jgi:putative hydrolase of the HAD superfamily